MPGASFCYNCGAKVARIPLSLSNPTPPQGILPSPSKGRSKAFSGDEDDMSQASAPPLPPDADDISINEIHSLSSVGSKT